MEFVIFLLGKMHLFIFGFYHFLSLCSRSLPLFTYLSWIRWWEEISRFCLVLCRQQTFSGQSENLAKMRRTTYFTTSLTEVCEIVTQCSTHYRDMDCLFFRLAWNNVFRATQGLANKSTWLGLAKENIMVGFIIPTSR